MNDRLSGSPAYLTKWVIAADWLSVDATVSTLAAIDSFVDYGNQYQDLMFVFKVTGANPAAFQIDHTEDPTNTYVEDLNSGAAIREVACSNGKQATLRLMDIGELGWRVSAYSTNSGNPNTTVNRRILGRRRL